MNKIIYLFKRIIGLDFKGLWDRVEQVRELTGMHHLAILWDMLLCGIRYEAGYIDYTIFGMYDMTDEQRATILTRGKNTRYVRALNNREDYHYFNNKTEFLALFEKECGREFLDLSQSDPDTFADFVIQHPIFIAKPQDGLCGKGVEKCSLDPEEGLMGLYNRLKTGGQTLLEPVLEQHDKINKIYAGSVNTLRMVTMVDDEGNPHLLYSALRIGSGGAVVDNFNSGGMVVPVDPKTGKLEKYAVNKAGQAFERHPDTDILFEGYALPLWKQSLLLTYNASKKVPGVRLVGWDLCITPDGPVLVEGNHYPGHDIYRPVPQNPEKKGLLPAFNAVVPYSSLEERIKEKNK